MRRRITLLAGTLVAGVVAAFVLPLGFLVQTMSMDAAVTGARDEAQRVAILVAGVDNPETLGPMVGVSTNSHQMTYVSMPDGTVVGDQAAVVGSEQLVAQVRASTRSVTRVGDSRCDVAVPVGLGDGTAVVHTTVDLLPIRRGIVLAWAVLGVLGLFLVAISLLVARQLSDRISTPLTDMASVARRLQGGDLDARATGSGPTEVVQLGSALNELADRIVELVAQSRAEAADLSHRLRTPVTALRLDADLVTDPRLRDRLRGHVDGLQHVIDGVVTEARRPTREALPAGCDAVAVVAARAGHWAPLAEDQGRRTVVALPHQPVRVRLSEQDLADLVDNLVDNVFAHTAEGVGYRISLTSDDHLATLTVEDAGSGLPGRAQVARGHSGDGGTGLGLDIVRKLAVASGGDIALGRSALGGLGVKVRLGAQAPGA